MQNISWIFSILIFSILKEFFIGYINPDDETGLESFNYGFYVVGILRKRQMLRLLRKMKQL
jgi:hypothetical protein